MQGLILLSAGYGMLFAFLRISEGLNLYDFCADLLVQGLVVKRAEFLASWVHEVSVFG